MLRAGQAYVLSLKLSSRDPVTGILSKERDWWGRPLFC